MQELGTGIHAAAAQFDGVPRRDLPCRPELLAVTFSADPTADELAVVRITAEVMDIEVVIARELVTMRRDKSLGTQCEM
jgi:hypothetical protein